MGWRSCLKRLRRQFLSARILFYVSIEIPVCQTCGERYYDWKTMRYLEQVEEELRAGHGELRQVGKLLAYG